MLCLRLTGTLIALCGFATSSLEPVSMKNNSFLPCVNVGRVSYCKRGSNNIRRKSKVDMTGQAFIVEQDGSMKRGSRKGSMTFTLKIPSGSLEVLTRGLLGPMLGEVVGPVSQSTFNETGDRQIKVSMPQIGRAFHWDLLEKDPKSCGIGTVLWPLGLLLANQMAQVPEYPRRRVLELSAGVGLSSLALAQRGHSVVATDTKVCVLKNLQHNVARGKPHSASVRVERLRREVIDDRKKIAALGPFDSIIGSNLLREEASCDTFRATLKQLLAPGGQAFIVEQDGSDYAASNCAEVMRSDDWEVERAVAPKGPYAIINGESVPSTRAESSEKMYFFTCKRRGSA